MVVFFLKMVGGVFSSFEFLVLSFELGIDYSFELGNYCSWLNFFSFELLRWAGVFNYFADGCFLGWRV